MFSWKSAVVVTRSKTWRMINCSPISLLLDIGKITEAVILSGLRSELQAIATIPVEQFDFLAGLSTDFQLFRLTEAIQGGLEKRDLTLVVFFYISKSFDSVWQDDLLYKLSMLRISTTLLRLINSYLESRMFRVRCAFISQVNWCWGSTGVHCVCRWSPSRTRCPPEVHANSTAVFTVCGSEKLAIFRFQRSVDV